MLDRLDKTVLPVHITPPVEKMVKAMAAALPFPKGLMMRQLLNPKLTDFVLNLLGDAGKAFVPMFHHTVNATIIRGGNKINVIPGEIEVHLDVRILPGFEPDDVVKELRPIIGHDVDLDLLFFDKGPADTDLALFDTLAGILKEADPGGIPVPFMLTGSSDARFFSRIGIRSYGFIPMQLPPEMSFWNLIHAANERIPVDTLKFGKNALLKAMQRFHQG